MNCNTNFTIIYVLSFVIQLFSTQSNVCTPIRLNLFNNGDNVLTFSTKICKEQCVASVESLLCPLLNLNECQFFDKYGRDVRRCDELQDGQDLYGVPFGKLFVWPTYEISFQNKLSKREDSYAPKEEIILETLSIEPRIFRLINFFSDEEANTLIETAIATNEPGYAFMRSSVGAKGYNPHLKRTSEGAFDVASEISIRIKMRSFDLLGIRPYDETYADGLQILRYNQTAAYVAHLDWLDQGVTPITEHDYDSSKDGTNRFATILLYLTDVEEGGETVFTEIDKNAKPLSYSDATIQEVNEASDWLHSRNLSHLFASDSWELQLLAQCRSRFAVQPRRAEALLFYSQTPAGLPDRSSKHGGCPVIQGQKWAANLWIWNGPRPGYTAWNSARGRIELNSLGESLSSRSRVSEASPVEASFRTRAWADGARLFWESADFGELKVDETIKVRTFPGHIWTVRDGAGDRVLAVWTISGSSPVAEFIYEPTTHVLDLYNQEEL